jgi:uncharacterized protein (DUF1778 family)
MAQAQRVAKRKPLEARLEARITHEQKELIERAAYLRGTSVTDFVVASTQVAAAEIIKDFDVLTLRGESRDVFMNALLNPPAPGAAARAAATRYKRRTGAMIAQA